MPPGLPPPTRPLALGHRAISIDLNPEYHKVACERVKQPPRWLLRRRAEKPSATERFEVEDAAHTGTEAGIAAILIWRHL